MAKSKLTVEKLIDDAKTYRPEVIKATKALARSKPWQGTIAERQEKLRAYHVKMTAIYELTLGLEFTPMSASAMIGTFNVIGRDDTKRIVMHGKFSIVNYLHAFTLARGAGKRECYKWSLNLFKRCFPKSFERAEKHGPNLCSAGTQARMEAMRESFEQRLNDLERNDNEERDESGDL